MKMGKTGALIAWIKDRIAANKEKPHADATVRVVYVTFRQTFSSSIVARLVAAGLPFESYSSIRTNQIDLELHPLIVVQVESLCRVNISTRNLEGDIGAITALVLDESESVFGQFTSPFVQSASLVWATFARLSDASQHVICMDANLGSRTVRLVEGLRSRAGPSEIGGLPLRFYYENYEPNAAGETMAIVPTARALFGEVYRALVEGKKIFICSSSLDDAKCLAMALSVHFKVTDITGPKSRIFDGSFDADLGDPDALADEPAKASELDSARALTLAMYTSETSPTVKTTHFSNVAHWWSKLDVLIYTPTVTAGISFEEKHFDVAFGIFSNTSCDVETCRQMMGRIRDVKDRRAVVCLQITELYHPTNRVLVERLLLGSAALREVSDALGASGPAPVEASYDGASITTKRAYHFDIAVENIIHANASRNSFAARFLDQVAETGVSISFVEESLESGPDFNKSALREAYVTTDAARIVAAEPLSTEEYYAIMEAKGGASGTAEPRPITADDMIRARKTGLMILYAIGVHEMTTDWVAKYARAETMRRFRNVLEFGPAITWGLVTATKTLIAVEAELAAAQPTRSSADRRLKRWFVCRVLTRLGIEHFGERPRGTRGCDELIRLLTTDLHGRLAQSRHCPVHMLPQSARMSVWSIMGFEFGLGSGARTRSILTTAMAEYFGITLNLAGLQVTYPVPIVTQALTTMRVKMLDRATFDE